jgi:hypothetical protein
MGGAETIGLGAMCKADSPHKAATISRALPADGDGGHQVFNAFARQNVAMADILP